MAELVGYARIVERYELRMPVLRLVSQIATAAHGRRARHDGQREIQELQPSYRPEDSLEGDLKFALRYEGVNLTVLALLFEKKGKEAIQQLITRQLQSTFSRRIGYLYEWITGKELDIAPSLVSPKSAYVPVLDEALQFGMDPTKSARDTKYRVINIFRARQRTVRSSVARAISMRWSAKVSRFERAKSSRGTTPVSCAGPASICT